MVKSNHKGGKMQKKTEVEKKDPGALVPAATNPVDGKSAVLAIESISKNFIESIRVEMKTNENLVAYFGDIKVRSAADLEKAVAVLAAIKTYYKAKDKDRDDLIGPFKSAIKDADAAYKKFKDFIESTLSKINLEISCFRLKEAKRIAKINAEREAKAEAERKRIEAEAAKAAKKKGADKELIKYNADQAIAAAEQKNAPKEQAKSVGGTSFRSIPDRDKIQAAIDKADGKILIPGVRVYKVWNFEIENAPAVPAEYRKESTATR